MPYKKPNPESKDNFFKSLNDFNDSIAEGSREDIIRTGVQLKNSLETAPISYKRYASHAFRYAIDKMLLTEQE